MDTAQAEPTSYPTNTGYSRRKAVTKFEILEAAINIVVENGFDGCTMRAVGSGVGMKAGSIYYHFASKDEIIEEILNIGI